MQHSPFKNKPNFQQQIFGLGFFFVWALVVASVQSLIYYVIIFLDIVIVNFLNMQANHKICNFIVGLKFIFKQLFLFFVCLLKLKFLNA